MFPCRNLRGRINSDVSTLSWQGNEIDPHLTLPRYIHLLMTYEHLTSRGDDSPKWTEIELCNQPCLIVMKLEKTYPIQSRSNTKLTN